MLHAKFWLHAHDVGLCYVHMMEQQQHALLGLNDIDNDATPLPYGKQFIQQSYFAYSGLKIPAVLCKLWL